MRQFSQIVAEYPAASIRTKLSSGILSLRNEQVASIDHPQLMQTLLLALPALKHSSGQSPLSISRQRGCSGNKFHNSYGALPVAQQGRAMGIVSDIEKALQIPRLGTALLAILIGALLLMIPWLLNYLVAIGLIIWGIAEAVKASNASSKSPSTK